MLALIKFVWISFNLPFLSCYCTVHCFYHYINHSRVYFYIDFIRIYLNLGVITARLIVFNMSCAISWVHICYLFLLLCLCFAGPDFLFVIGCYYLLLLLSVFYFDLLFDSFVTLSFFTCYMLFVACHLSFVVFIVVWISVLNLS